MAAAVVAATLGGIAGARAAGEQPVSVAVPPCRLFDTRPGADNVGAKNTPLAGGIANAMTVNVFGASGRCNLPRGIASVRLNVTIVSPSATSFLAVTTKPSTSLSSTINWTAGQAPKSNFAETTVNSDGSFFVVNQAGTVDVLADVTGYTIGHSPNQLDLNEVGRGRWEKDPGRDLTTATTTDGRPVFDGRNIWFPRNNIVTNVGGAQSDLLRLFKVDTVSGQTTDVDVTLRSVAHTTATTTVVADTLFDGTSIWVAYYQQSTTNASSVSELRLAKVDPATARLVTTVTLLTRPRAMAFDGSRIWVATDLINVIVRVDASTGAVLSPNLPVGAAVNDLVFDGSKMWMTGTRSDPFTGTTLPTTFSVDPTTGTTVNSTGGGLFPNLGLGFDGSRIWVRPSFGTTIPLIQASTGESAGSVALPGTGSVRDLVFDGSAMWVSGAALIGGTTSLTVVNVTTLSSTTALSGTGTGPDLLFDGTAVWSSSPLRRHRVG